MSRYTDRLIENLSRIFSKDPLREPALTVQYDGQMTWTVSEWMLTFTVTGGTGQSLSFPLRVPTTWDRETTIWDAEGDTQTIWYDLDTIADLAFLIGRQQGFSAYVNPEFSTQSAYTLLDGTGTVAANVEAILGVHTSLLWVILDSFAWELTVAKLAIANMVTQMTIPTATDEWQDAWGFNLGIPRIPGEFGADYVKRIIEDALQVKSNNLALERSVLERTGIAISVVDIDWVNDYKPVQQLRTNTENEWTNQPARVIGPTGSFFGPINNGIIRQLGLATAAGVPPLGGYPYYGAAENDNPLNCAFAVLIGVVLTDDELDSIKALIRNAQAAGTVALYFTSANDALRTNTLGEKTNTQTFICGPGGLTYTQLN